MLKDTKSLGNNKAPACESRGFVLKKEGVLFDTPSFFVLRLVSVLKRGFACMFLEIAAKKRLVRER